MNTLPPPLESEHRVADNGLGFRLPEASLFYTSPALEEVLDRVCKLVDDSRDIAVLTGPRGVGKTTLVYRLQSSIPDNWRICRVDCHPMMHPDQLLIRLARCVAVRPVEDDMTEAVGQALARLRRQGYVPVILLDDAEQLPIRSLITLMRLHEQQVESTPVCALILLAQDMIDRTLTTHQLHAMGTSSLVRLEMPLLSSEQIGDYIRHSLRVEGLESDLDLDAEQLAGIHRDSGGLPGRVNDLVIRALRKPGFRSYPALTERLIRMLRDIPPLTATATAVVAALLILSTLFQTQIDSLFQQSEPVQRQLTDTFTPAELPPPMEPLMEPKPPHNTPSSQPLQLPPRTGTSQSPELDSPASSPERKNPAALSEAASQRRAQPEIAEQPPTTNTAAATPRPPSPTLVSTERHEETAPSTPAETEPRPKREAWLLQQAPGAYSLQILAAGSEAAVQRFLQQHALDREVYYFESRRKGLPWFAVLHGIYKNRETAVAALKELPEPLRKAGAWPRVLSSIQKEIRQVR